MTDWERFLEVGGLLDRPGVMVGLAEEWLRVRDRRGRLVPLVANRAQRSFEERCGRENVVLKARQMGLSTWVAGRFLLKTMLVPGTVTVQVAQTWEAAEGLFRIVQRMWENLPTPLREGHGRRGRANASAMSFPEVDSEFRVLSAAEPNAGRGMTVTHLHLSEVSRWQGDAAETLAGLRAAQAAGGEMVLESTPNGAFGCFFEAWQTVESRGGVRHFFPWWWERAYVAQPVLDELTSEEMALVAGEGLTAEQIGFRRGLAERFGPLRGQEFAEDAVSCFRESGACVFEVSDLVTRLAEVPEASERRWGGALLVWRLALRGRTYMVAADPAGGGVDGDYAAVQVLDVLTGLQCAEMRAHVTPRELAGRLEELAREYGGALIAVERNNHGAAVLAYLERAQGLRVYEGADGQAGWLTTAASRGAMVARLGVLLATRAEMFLSGRLLEECRRFVLKEGGRMEAAAGCHDDLVMAMAMGQMVREGMVKR